MKLLLAASLFVIPASGSLIEEAPWEFQCWRDSTICAIKKQNLEQLLKSRGHDKQCWFNS